MRSAERPRKAVVDDVKCQQKAVEGVVRSFVELGQNNPINQALPEKVYDKNNNVEIEPDGNLKATLGRAYLIAWQKDEGERGGEWVVTNLGKWVVEKLFHVSATG